MAFHVSQAEGSVLVIIIAISAVGIGIVGWVLPAVNIVPRFSIQFQTLPSSGTKYSLDADPNIVNGLTTTIARQGQFPNLGAGASIYIYYVWCDTTVSGGNLILQQTGGTGWIYTFACGTGQSSSGDPGSTVILFYQTLA